MSSPWTYYNQSSPLEKQAEMHRRHYMEQPGSVTLKSNIPMEYSRAVLTNIWHQKRQAEPKDNDMNTLPVRSMQISTYKQIATDGETKLPRSTTQDQQDQPFLERSLHVDRDCPRKMIDRYNMNVANAALNGLIERVDPQIYRRLLPERNPSEQGKIELETTYHADFPPPYPYEMKTVAHSAFDGTADTSATDRNKSWGHRKMISHFSDLDQPKRDGINTFHVQHAQYENEHIRRDLGHFQPSAIQ